MTNTLIISIAHLLHNIHHQCKKRDLVDKRPFIVTVISYLYHQRLRHTIIAAFFVRSRKPQSSTEDEIPLAMWKAATQR